MDIAVTKTLLEDALKGAGTAVKVYTFDDEGNVTITNADNHTFVINAKSGVDRALQNCAENGVIAVKDYVLEQRLDELFAEPADEELCQEPEISLPVLPVAALEPKSKKPGRKPGKKATKKAA